MLDYKPFPLPFLITAVVLVFFVLLVAVVVLKKLLRGSVEANLPYYCKKILSSPEQILYHRLVAALPDYIILSQVQVSRVLGVKKGFNFHEWNNRINRLSYDFIICSKDLTVVAAVELDDKSHEAASRIEANGKKDKATLSAGIPLIRWNVKAMPDVSAIKSAILPVTS